MYLHILYNENLTFFKLKWKITYKALQLHKKVRNVDNDGFVVIWTETHADRNRLVDHV